MHLGFVCNGFTRQQCFVYVALICKKGLNGYMLNH